MRFGKDTYRDMVWSYRFTRESSLVSVKVIDNCQQRSGECVGRMKITRTIASGMSGCFMRDVYSPLITCQLEVRAEIIFPQRIKESIQFVFIQALQGFVTFKCQSCCLNHCLPKRCRASE